ncbi:MAG: DNA-processing protein DprA, partial [Chloroherpetonaceae bacterium]|nr:DNA-processing protein DprA [Chthonomonadaceae bacterium]MDW8209118.1 DNA-processing protein DprA [Chloroherpetonaceae bacterium]
AFIPTERQLRAMHRLSAHVLLLPDPEYPPPLRDIPEPPPLLFISGTLNERDRFSIAMVGSRQATPYGRNVAERFARELAGHGLTIVSGGAIGIDAAAHRGALAAGGRTHAVLGCGLDVDYPREHRTLFEQIRQQGALITEYPPGAMPEAWRFPQRNRIVSGLAQGLLVVEAPAQSGALITARIAAEQGRTVMAVPGNIDRAASVGCHELLKDGATLIACPEDVLRALNLTVVPAQRPYTLNLFATTETPATASRPQPHAPAPHLPERQQRLLQALSLTPQHIDTLALHTGLSASEASMELTLLEINGLARRMPGNTYIRTL